MNWVLPFDVRSIQFIKICALIELAIYVYLLVAIANYPKIQPSLIPQPINYSCILYLELRFPK